MITIDPAREPYLARIVEKIRRWTSEKKRGDLKVFVKDGEITRFVEERVSSDLMQS